MKPRRFIPVLVKDEDWKDWEKVRTIMEANFDRMMEIDQASKDAEQILWRVVSHPIADGRAWYQVTKENKRTVRIEVCTGLGDDWVIPAWGEVCTVDKDQIADMIHSRDELAKIFGG